MWLNTDHRVMGDIINNKEWCGLIEATWFMNGDINQVHNKISSWNSWIILSQITISRCSYWRGLIQTWKYMSGNINLVYIVYIEFSYKYGSIRRAEAQYLPVPTFYNFIRERMRTLLFVIVLSVLLASTCSFLSSFKFALTYVITKIIYIITTNFLYFFFSSFVLRNAWRRRRSSRSQNTIKTYNSWEKLFLWYFWR